MLKAGIIPGLFISAVICRQQKKPAPGRFFYIEDIALVGRFRFVLRRALEVVSQRIFVAVQRDSDLTTVDQRAKQQFVRQRFFQVVLNDASHWTCPIARS